jgi:UDP-3-O-[3-hydroxymyristoyl] glucosamine N-acyltransferase
MRLTAAQIAELVGGTVKGDTERVVEGANTLADATGKDVSFLCNPKYSSQLKTTRAGVVIVPPDVPVDGRTVVVMKNPPYGWARVLELLQKERTVHPAGIHPTAVIDPSAKLGKNVAVGAHTVIEANAVIGDNTIVYAQCYVGHGSRIGAECLIYPQVVIRDNVRIGDRCIFQPGAVIGADGYGFAFHNGRHYKIPQVGGVEIGDDVEIQANTTVDRGAIGPTRIGRGTKIDNLVQVAHNVETGEHCLLVALTGVAGSVKMGNYVTLGAQVGVAGHLTIGDGVICASRGGISHSIKPKEVVWGTPAQPIKDEMKMLAAMRRLPKLLDELKELKKKLGV